MTVLMISLSRHPRNDLSLKNEKAIQAVKDRVKPATRIGFKTSHIEE
jgi:hypothetical protein